MKKKEEIRPARSIFYSAPECGLRQEQKATIALFRESPLSNTVLFIIADLTGDGLSGYGAVRRRPMDAARQAT
jgi:hypothetical protein